ncbi:MAG: tRNA (adenosine(37)-N6)-threonylcarbamoyltransferase complex ATPase subunit type 1 TsaE [bacterium]
MTSAQIFHTYSAAETEGVGRRLSKLLSPGDVVLLIGTLGSGKTVLVRGIARGLGIRVPIVSPTFVLRKPYPVRHRRIRALNHVDAYRLTSPDDLRGLLDEEFLPDAQEIWCVEWGEKIRTYSLPGRVLRITIKILGDTRRRLILSGISLPS